MNSKEFITRRKNVFDLMEDDSVMIVFSNLKSEKKTEIQRNFYYLSGIIEEGEILLLFKNIFLSIRMMNSRRNGLEFP